MANPDNPLVTRAKAMGLPMKFDRQLIPSTRRAHQAAEWARTKGVPAFERLHRALLERYWVRGESLHEWSVLRGAATDAGLDGDELVREVERGNFKQAMEEGLAAAAEVGVTAVPTFIVGNRFVIQGAQEGSVFKLAFERLGFSPRATSPGP